MQFDDIVVGGGTAGAVISARLSEEHDRRVLLLEAGPDYPDTVPRELLDPSFAVLSGHNWEMQATVWDVNHAGTGHRARNSRVFEAVARAVGQSTVFPYPLGKVTGGGSAINGGLALHARPEDYARWTTAGCDEWSWERVRPYVDRIATADSGKPALPVETTSPEDLTPCQRAFLHSCHVLGNRAVDLCQGITAGVGPIPKSVRRGQRVSTSTLYLAAARSRTNLTIRSNCLVDKLLLEPRNGLLTAIGVEALADGVRRRFSGEHIIVSAGAINSPAILLRSGIGPAAEIARSNLRPVLDLPGVGKNLQDHPSVCIWATPRKGSCVAGEPVHQLMAQRKSKASNVLCDVQLYMLSAVPTHGLPPLHLMAGSDLALGVSAVLATPRSSGRVEVVDADATKNPRIYLNCLQESSDLRGMMEAVRSAWCILRREPLALHIDRFLLWTQNVIDCDVLLENSIRAMVRGTWHPVGTLRMGKEGDSMAVVDQRGRLYGCQNVTVSDASIMPIIPSVPPNLTCMLIGERIAADLRGREM
jgi:choline dehydrogenase